jgi:methylated-DNA-[protein]-cysteine S-methyltransferase
MNSYTTTNPSGGSHTDAFLVATPLLSLAVTVFGEAVTGIRLGATASRLPTAVFERGVAEQLSEYLAGSRTTFTVPMAPAGTPFQQAVWKQLCAIPYGRTQTYGEVAAAIGNRGAARAVGMANHRNPIPIMIPCHRVVAAGGKLGGYGGGQQLKRRLLRLEATQMPLFG